MHNYFHQLVSHLLGIVTFTEVVIISLAVQKYCPILDIFLLPSVRVLVPWPSPVTGPSHLNCVASVLLPLDQKNIAEHVRTVPLLDVEEEMEISIASEILPGNMYINIVINSVIMKELNYFSCVTVVMLH